MTRFIGNFDIFYEDSPNFVTEQQIRKVMKASQRSEIQRSISPIEEMENHASPAPANGGYVYDR